MKKIDQRIAHFIVFDSETCNTINDNGKLDMSNVLCYDTSGVVCDKRGKIYEKFSYIPKEIWEMKDLMQSAYYAHKIPLYEEMIAKGEMQVLPFYEIRKRLLALVKEYRVKAIMSHNARFDCNALKITQRYITKSKYRFFLPFDLPYWDTLKMAQDTICKQKRYIKFCQENGYMTKHKTPRPRATAEILYRYITGNNEFIESHTGLDDSIIEAQIFAHCVRQHKKMRKALYE